MSINDTYAIDLTELLHPHENQWVAIAEDYSSVLAAATSYAELQRAAKNIKERYIAFKVFPFDVSYIPPSA